MNKAKKLYGIMTLALALSLANTVPVKAVAVDEAFAGVVSASKNTTSTALADAETCTACGKKTAIGSAERIPPGRPPERQEIANTILSTD